MMELMSILVGLSGIVLGVFVTGLLFRAQWHSSRHEVTRLQEQLDQVTGEVERLHHQYSESEQARIQAETRADRVPVLEKQLQESQNALLQTRTQLSEARTQLESERVQNQEKLQLLNQAREQLKSEFENLAQQILESKSKKFPEQNRENLSGLLSPLKEQLDGFRRRVDDVYEKDSTGRTKLLHEIDALKSLNQRISEEAMNLTNALRSETKTQGNWGEMVLERLLEQSGLRKGKEYEVQGNFRSEAGTLQRPDVVIHLPEDKDMIVDSKVSLKAYDEFVNADDTKDKEQALKRLVLSLRNHVKELRGKNYDHLQGVRTLDYVLMFVPVEAAFMVAVEYDPNIYQDTMDHHIMVVTPSTLMVALKTIHNIWRYEHQNENVLEIARQGGELYDKFVGFTESLLEIGNRLEQAQDAYQTAQKRLVTGRGNLVNKAESLKQLGARAKKQLPIDIQEEKDKP